MNMRAIQTATRRIHRHALRASLLLILVAPHAQAGEITGLTWHSGVASVAGEFIVAPSAPNNDDNVGVSPNVVYVLQKNYVGIGPVDIEFTVADTGGVTEYRIEEGVFNGTGLAWSGYHLELGFGVGSSFVKATLGSGLDFDAPDFNSPNTFSTFFTGLPPSELDLIATGMMPTFEYASGILFHIDVPDGLGTFTLRQSPIPVPEPSTAAGLLAATALVVRSRRPSWCRR